MELQFTVGEALTNAAVGSCSGAARDVWTCTEDQYCPPDSKYVRERQSEDAVRVQTQGSTTQGKAFPDTCLLDK